MIRLLAVAALGLVFVGGTQGAGTSGRLVEVARVPAARFESGPTLAGSALMWAERTKSGAVAVRAADRGAIRTIFRARRPAVPDDAPSSPGTDVSVSQDVWAASSASTVAVLRIVRLVYVPKCRPVCLAPIIQLPFFSQLWVGSPRGGFHRVAGRRPAFGAGCTRSRPTWVDVSGAAVLYSELTETCDSWEPALQWSRVVLRPRRGAARTLLRSPRRLTEVALAGRFAGWAELYSDAEPAIVVYDISRNRVSYRVRRSDLPRGGVQGFDLQADGTSAIVAERVRPAIAQAVAWASPGKPEPHWLRAEAYGANVRIVGGRIAVASQVSTARGWRTEAALVDLRNRMTTVASFRGRAPRFAAVAYVDFDGRSVAFALWRSPRGVTSLYRLRL